MMDPADFLAVASLWRDEYHVGFYDGLPVPHAPAKLSCQGAVPNRPTKEARLGRPLIGAMAI